MVSQAWVDKESTASLYALLALRHRSWGSVALVVVLILGGAISIGSWVGLSRHYDRLLRAQFEGDSQLRLRAVDDRLRHNLEAALSLGGLFQASVEVSREEFVAFVGPLLTSCKERQAACWIPRIGPSQRRVHEQSQQAELQALYEISEWGPDGQLRRAGNRPEYFPIAIVEPPGAIRLPMGLDLGASTKVAQKLWAAAEGNEPTALRFCLLAPSEKLSQEVNDWELILWPVYRRGQPGTLPAERRKGLLGFAGVVVDVSEALREALAGLPACGIDVSAYDDPPECGSALLAWETCSLRSRPFVPRSVQAEALEARLYRAERLATPGMPWTILCTPTDLYELRSVFLPPWVVLAAGLSLSLFAAAYVSSLVTRTARVEELVAQRAADLRRAKESLEAEIERRKIVEQDLRDSQALYSSLVENLPVHVLRKDLEGRFTFANQSFCRLVGKSLEELKGKTDYDLYPAELADKYRADDRWVVESGQLFECEEENIQDGRRRFVHVMKSPVRDAEGKIVGTQVVFWDVTAQREAQAALEHERYLLHALMDHLPHAIYFKDREGRYLRINKALARSIGLDDPAQALGKTDFDFFAPEYAVEARRDELRVMDTGLPIVDKEERVIWRDGRSCWMSTTKLPLLDERGQIVGTFGISRDITERRKAAEALRAAKEAAESASQAKSTFLANMSHEIRNPLNAIVNMARLLLDGPVTKEQRDYLLAIKESGETLEALINDILDFSKIEAGRLTLEEEPFDLHETVQDTMRWLAIRAHQKGLEIACHLRRGVPVGVVGDNTRLRQVIVNLVSNAIKFTERGEVELTVEPEGFVNGHVILHFKVRDTGIGISPDKIHKIFEAFEQGDTTRRRRYGGTGLGLAISRRLVEAMGGRIWVESTPNVGSTFHFTVRLGLSPEEKEEPHLVIPPLLRGLRVLVVDDNATNRRILGEILESWEMQPILAESVEQALAILVDAERAGNSIPLVITDVNMPGQDGYELVRIIKQDKKLGSTVIMMLSSGERPEDLRHVESLGVSAYLLKPVKQSELLDAIIMALGVEPVEDRRESVEIFRRVPRRPLRVLLVEDSLINQKLAVGMLHRWGHEVVVASNGLEAVQIYQKEHFDLILMDVQMPEMDGFEATEAIRALERRTGKHVPILAMTAHALKGDRERCLAAGMDDYVGKPIRPELLFEKLELLTAAFPVRPAAEVSALASQASEAQSGQHPTPVQPLGPKDGALVLGGESSDKPPGEAVPADSPIFQAALSAGVQAEQALSVGRPQGGGAQNGEPAPSFQPPSGQAVPVGGGASDLGQPAQPSGEPKMEPPAPKSGQPEPSPWPEFSLQEALRSVRGDTELLRVVCEAVVEDTPRLLNEIEKAISEKNAKNLRLYAHTLKGSIRYFGPTELFNRCFELEKMGRDGLFDGAEELFALVKQDTERLRSFLQSYLQSQFRP
ncbi:MAG: response regulator [Thermoguttaceae bacterium]|nr:response regulator [Thermoguttaceae bacterium]MDW8079380.1 response regulator [Thermoguttaceae bacterium]